MGEKKTRRAGKYFFLGILNTLIGYVIYEILALTIFSGEGQLKHATFISGVVSIFTGYYLHSHYTWKERKVGKQQVFRFFIWNAILAAALKPGFTEILEKIDFLYKFAFGISQALHLPFSYDFVRSTGNFVLVMAIVMVLNFLIYDRFVFGEKPVKENKKEKNREEIEVESVRKAREEKKREKEA